jgi:hypothetical protein
MNKQRPRVVRTLDFAVMVPAAEKQYHVARLQKIRFGILTYLPFALNYVYHVMNRHYSVRVKYPLLEKAVIGAFDAPHNIKIQHYLTHIARLYM